MSLNNLNETTKNLLKAFEDYSPPETSKIIIKLTYDKSTGIIDGHTFEDTNKPWIEITREQYDKGVHLKRLRVVDGKLEEIQYTNVKKTMLVEGNRWFTTKENMLIIGNERGWDERGNS